MLLALVLVLVLMALGGGPGGGPMPDTAGLLPVAAAGPGWGEVRGFAGACCPRCGCCWCC